MEQVAWCSVGVRWSVKFPYHVVFSIHCAGMVGKVFLPAFWSFSVYPA